MNEAKKTLIYSVQGKGFDGKKLSEDNLPAGQSVAYHQKLYKTGNRRGELVELHHPVSGNLTFIARVKSIRLVKYA